VSVAEGIAAEVVGACSGGAVLTGWALFLGCSPALIGILGALPFLAQLVQPPAARLVDRFGPRRVALVTVALSRQAYLPLIVLPFLGLAPTAARALLVAVAVASQALAIACNNAWMAWMGELVPAGIRGRYFGRRTAVCTAAGAAVALAAGVLLDRAPGPIVLAALTAVTCAAGAVSVVLMARQTGGRPRPHAAPGPSLLCVLRVSAARRWAAQQLVSGGGAGLIVPFSSLYVLRDRGLGFTFLAGYGALSAAARIGSSRAWGRLLDRRCGPRAVVHGSAALLAASPLLWVLAAWGGPWVFAVEAVTGGVATAGASVAGLAIPLALAPRAERPAWGAVFALAGGLGFGAGTFLAMPLAALLPARAAFAGPLTAPFLASVALRAVAAAMALRMNPSAGPGNSR
jgi:MFS family permease